MKYILGISILFCLSFSTVGASGIGSSKSAQHYETNISQADKPINQETDTISGCLVDEDGKPVGFADIVIRKASSTDATYGTSDAEGKFSFSVEKGRYTIEITSIGYTSLKIDCFAENLGVILMAKDIEQLDAVTVKAQRTVEKSGNFLVVPDPQDVSASGKGIDLLAKQQLPGLKVDKALKTITIDGGTPILKINGKEVSIQRITNLNPQNIKRIEYSNTAGARYLDRGATGVINIVLKEADDGGNVELDAEGAFTTWFLNGYANASYHKGHSEFLMEYYGSYRNYHKNPSSDTETFTDEQRTVQRTYETNVPFRYDMHDISLEYTFQKNDSTMFVADLTNSLFRHRKDGFEGTMKQIDRGIRSELDMFKKTSKDDWQPKLDLFYTRKMTAGQKLEFNLVGETANSNTDDYTRYTDHEGNIEEYPIIVYNKGWALSAEGVYNKHFTKVDTRFGIQYKHNRASNDYRISQTISTMDKDNAYFFAQADGTVGEKFSWNAGTGLKILSVTEAKLTKTYFRNLSTARINWRIDERWSLTADASYTPNLPNLGDLSEVLQVLDDVTGVCGNTKLVPDETISGRIMLRFAAKNGWFANLYCGNDHGFNTIIYRYRYDSATDLFVSSPENAIGSNNLWAKAEAGVKNLWDHVNFMADAKYKHMQSNGSNFRNSQNNFSSNIDFQLVWEKISGGCRFTILPEWVLNGENLLSIERSQNIYFQYRWKDLTASLIWHCPFNSKGYSYELKYLSEVHSGHHINYTRENANMIVLGINWSFGFGKSFNKSEKTLFNGGYDSGTVK